MTYDDARPMTRPATCGGSHRPAFRFGWALPLLALLSLLMPVSARADEDACIFKNDIVYSTVDGDDLKLDLAMPVVAKGSYPLVLCLHGGGWSRGDKSKFDDLAKSLAAHGYVAASINYRFAPKYRFPAQLEDARASLRFLKAHAADYRIDTSRVATLGESAGAQLALLMGFQEDPEKPADGRPTCVQCVVNFFGPTDFTRWAVTPFHELLAQKLVHKSIAEITMALFGTSDLKSPVMAAASPVTFVTPHAPPVITFHGTLDPIVDFKQAEWLHETLRKAGITEKLVPVAGAHGHWLPDTQTAANKQAVEWLDTYLKTPNSTKTAMGTAKVDGDRPNH